MYCLFFGTNIPSGGNTLWPGSGQTWSWLDRSSQTVRPNCRPAGRLGTGPSQSANVPDKLGGSTARSWFWMGRWAKTRATTDVIIKTEKPSMAPPPPVFTCLSEVSHNHTHTTLKGSFKSFRVEFCGNLMSNYHLTWCT